MKWKSFYEKGGIIIADRYTTSNMVHQMTKYEDAEKREEFLSWLEKRNMRNWSCQGPISSFFLIFLFRCPKVLLKKSPSGRIHGYPRAASGLSEEMLRRLSGAGGPVWLETDFLYKRWKTSKHRGYWYRRGAGSSGSDEIVHRRKAGGILKEAVSYALTYRAGLCLEDLPCRGSALLPFLFNLL